MAKKTKKTKKPYVEVLDPSLELSKDTREVTDPSVINSGLIVALQDKIDQTNKRIDRIIAAHDKCKSLKGM